MNSSFKDYLLEATKACDCKEIEIIQSLWSGYGSVSRYHLIDSTAKTVVVKYIALSQIGQPKNHPRGWNTDNSHNRKVKSYEVETNWYRNCSQRCSSNSRIPKFLGSFTEGKDQWIVMEDLNVDFPLRKEQLNFSEVKVCLKWLANFHATFLGQKPIGLWDTGTYWHLETRPDEYKKIKHQELKAKAHLIDEKLNQCKFQTIVHGDAKLANFCFSIANKTETDEDVAAVDFQYVGGGCGMKDVAYFLGSCLSSNESELYEKELLKFYFDQLKLALSSNRLKIDFQELETEWREMYPFACADFTRFLLGWMPTHQKINGYNLKLLNSVLSSLQ